MLMATAHTQMLLAFLQLKYLLNRQHQSQLGVLTMSSFLGVNLTMVVHQSQVTL